MDKEEIKRRLDDACPSGSAASPAGAAWPCEGSVSLTPAAVLVALIAEPEGQKVILTLRTEGLRNHPAQISLPGGRVEPEDAGPAEAALREAWEEVGLSPGKVEILGRLPDYRTVSDYCVQPYVGWAEGPVMLTPDSREVAEVFLVPLEFVIDPANHTRESMMHEGHERSFWVLSYGDRRIWGATAGILVSLSRVLGSQAAPSGPAA